MLRHLTAHSPFQSNQSGPGNVLAFEVGWRNIIGLDYSNPLCLPGRVVLEAKHVIKREFLNVRSSLFRTRSQYCKFRPTAQKIPFNRAHECGIPKAQSKSDGRLLSKHGLQMRDVREVYRMRESQESSASQSLSASPMAGMTSQNESHTNARTVADSAGPWSHDGSVAKDTSYTTLERAHSKKRKTLEQLIPSAIVDGGAAA